MTTIRKTINEIRIPNREIKFRIWNDKTKLWIHGPHKSPVLDGVNLFGEIIFFGYLLRGVPIEEYDHCVALQYSGLKDVDDKEIFEGDIVRLEYDDGTCVNIQITFSDGSFCMNHGVFRINKKVVEYSKLKVIGNIFENRELIE